MLKNLIIISFNKFNSSTFSKKNKIFNIVVMKKTCKGNKYNYNRESHWGVV